jgi:hypothetical protein
MKTRLLICVKNPFCQRDADRMGLVILQKSFEVLILDCTSWLMPAALNTRNDINFSLPNLHRIKSYKQFCKLLSGRRGGLAIDYVGQFSILSLLMFDAIKSNGTKIIVIDSGSYPSPAMAAGKISKYKKLIDAIHHRTIYQIMKEKFVNIISKLIPDQSPDYALVAGDAWKSNQRFVSAKIKLPAHSFDYEVYINKRVGVPILSSKYAVYLDETIVGHEDNEELGLPQPASIKNFYTSLKLYFDSFETKTGLKVVIAAYPSADIEKISQLFGGRKVFIGVTAELIRDSSLVFAHASTAISYAILWSKPLVFLTSDEIIKSWYQPWIDSSRLTLDANLVNIDHFRTDLSNEIWNKYNEKAYKNYKYSFIKSCKSKDKSLWIIICELDRLAHNKVQSI